MPLPKLDVPIYELNLPSTNKELKYRPFLVKEEKILLMALESDDENEILKGMTQIISNCLIDSDLNIELLPTFDLEYIFLKLRSRSIGEISELTLKCENCEAENPYRVDLSKIEITKNENHTTEIKIDDNLGVVMKYPTAKTMTLRETTGMESVFDMIEDCVDTIYYNEESYDLNDYTKSEKRDFFDSLTQNQFEKIQDFFTTMPKIETEIEYNCIKCKENNKLTLEGLQNFFG